MKQKVIILLCAGMLLLNGCASGASQQDIPKPSEEVSTESIPENNEPEPSDLEEPQSDDKEEPASDDIEPEADDKEEPKLDDIGPKADETEEPQSDDKEEPASDDIEPETDETEEPQSDDKEEPQLDDSAYIGEYLDEDVKEPNLEIAKGEDGKFIVQIGIFRLTTLYDGVGELVEEGMAFTATDAAGNPISGMITIEGERATVTFTDSTWEYLENGSVYKYTKSSDTPNIWSE